MNNNDFIYDHLKEASDVLASFISNPENISKISEAGEVMVKALKADGKLFSCGNGGSMCDAMHFAEELTGKFREDRKSIAATAISDVGYMSCVGNDYGYDHVFSRYLEGWAKSGDVLLAISTSGNSKNVLKAAEVAKQLGVKVVSLTGKDGGKLSELSDVEIRVPHSGYADRIQEIHIKVIHTLIDYIERNLL